MNFSIVSVINDFIKMYYCGVRFMLQSQVKDRRVINTTEQNKKVCLQFVLEGEGVVGSW